MAEINGIKVPFIPINSPDSHALNRGSRGTTGFESIFHEELNRLKFSGHAMKRLESRNIQLNEEDMLKIQNAVEKAELKGAKESLVLLDETAFIINIPNKTVITAVNINSDDKVFTNIDSVVFT